MAQQKFFHHALKIDKDICIGCTHCMTVCPTEALRIINGKAQLLENRCVDCGECFRACPVSAIRIEEDDFQNIFDYKHRIALFPSVLVSQFPEGLPPEQIYSTLLEVGFTDIFEVEHTADILKEEANKYLKQHKDKKPLISTFCPAIVRLIQVKFPSLTNHLMLLKPPFDTAALYARKQLIDKGIDEKDIGIFYITPCAAKIAAVKSPVGENAHLINGVINMDSIYNKLLASIKSNKDNTCRVPVKNNLSDVGVLWSLTKGESENVGKRSLAIDGIQNVIEFLEKLENEEMPDIDFLELRACDESCAGGVLNVNNRFLTVEKMEERAEQLRSRKQEERDDNPMNNYQNFILENMGLEPVKPRSIDKLDEDMSKAMQKMQQRTKILEQLPGFDCGACGAPSCSALAEDIVNGKASQDSCIFVQALKAYLNIDEQEKAIQMLERIWGKNRIDINLDTLDNNESK
ncbi:MAG: 4Fe-4S binding protein [Bacteroidales bacterium]|nr:4Fe-4S binding protein [Bacteroidales bacterium]